MLSNLVSLRKLTITGPLFQNADDQLQFGSILAQNSLEEFGYEGALGCEWWPGASLGSLSRLKSICWKASENCDTPIEDRLSPMWDLLTSSRLTLTTLSLPFGVSEEDVNDQLWAMHFPSLRSLKLGVWEFDSTRAATGFTSFVLSHSTLEELDLDYGNYDDYALSFDESSLESLTAQSLPNLRTLGCNTHCLAVLLRAKVQSLCTLSSLKTGPGGVDDPTLAMDSLYRALSTFPNALSNLKELKLDLSQWEETERDDILDSIRRLSKYCGHKLETWHNGLPAMVQFSASRLRSIFTPFRQLRSLHLASRLILNNSQHNDVSVESSILALALSCRNLEEVHLESPGLKGEADGVWLIERGKEGSYGVNVHRRIVF
ncbi:hypothetical protein GALMADRAFT_245947 [Galerina marginata CBS 339.88]|uniref:F-box domain-containing protein n=1 Tax=Galerina marginata (strain CBS 339.88) TaxID=685588 RepID=A0A067T148_GALM3|nr:hypothetical protein GALMADRAFT_245947 [Galerina marginata CBS 339.88]